MNRRLDQDRRELRRSADIRVWPAMEALSADVRYGVRRLARDWPFTVAAILMLAIGIGANTAAFSLIDGVLFRGTPALRPDRLVDIYQNGSNPGGLDANSFPAYQDIAGYTDVFEDVTAVTIPYGVNYRHEGALRPAVVEHTTASYPAVVGLGLPLGRWFTPDEDARGAAVVAVLGHRAWLRKFHGDPSIVGRTIRIEGVPVIIVGVGPAGYDGTLGVGVVTDFWLPVAALPALGMPARVLDRRPEESPFLVKARLRDGVTPAQAQAAMRLLGARLAAEFPTEDPGKGISVFASADVRIHPQLDRAVRWAAFLLLGVVGLVLVVACSNIATLVLVRGASRAKELSIRLALGATRGELVRHLLIENLLLSTAGGAAGVLLASWSLAWLRTADLPVDVNLGLDSRVLAFTLGVSLVAGLAFGLVPARDATRLELTPTLRDDGTAAGAERGWLSAKNAFVVFQVTASFVLLAGTAIALEMLHATRDHGVRFAVDGVAMLQTGARYAGYSADQGRLALDDVRRRVAALPGVRGVVMARGLPMDVSGMRIIAEGATDGSAVAAGAIWAGPGFHDLLDIPMLFGRALDERDRRDTPRVAVVSEAMARRYFGTSNAVGRRFRPESDENGWFEIVGVARQSGTADLQGDLLAPTPYVFYRSFAQFDQAPDTLIARSSTDAAALAGAMVREAREVDAVVPILAAKTMTAYLEESLLAPKAAAATLGVMAAAGVGLAGLGLYAVVAFRVRRRSREIGIRMALGARGRQVVWAMTREVVALLAAGSGAGACLSLALVLAFRAVAEPAPGISLYRPSMNPVAWIAIVVFMGAVGVAAASVPAWRAARVDPLNALRRE